MLICFQNGQMLADLPVSERLESLRPFPLAVAALALADSRGSVASTSVSEVEAFSIWLIRLWDSPSRCPAALCST